MNLIEQEERELERFVNEDPYGEEEENGKRSTVPKVFKARLNPVKPMEAPLEDKKDEE